jgi:phosphoribosylanthranilate isomerase
MGMALVKICGVNDAAGRDAALAGGAAYLGFVFFATSPRNLAPAAASALAGPVRGHAETVAVTVDADDALLTAIASHLAPDWLQLHGKESLARAAAVRRFARKGVIKAVSVAQADDLAGAEVYRGSADMLLLDAKAPADAALPGGNGAAFDWTLLTSWRPPLPWMLSGGLTPENVKAALEMTGAPRADVSSGVEAAPGVKDPIRIRSFLVAANAASARDRFGA